MSNTRTLLFDLDGTLTDSFDGISGCVAYAIDRMSHPPPSQDDLRRCVGPPLRESFARLLATTDTDAIECAVKYYRERFSDLGWRENAVYPGVDAVLATLARGGHRMFVCTSKPLIYAERIIAHFALAPYFEATYGATLDASLDDKATLVATLISQYRLDAASCAMIGDRAQDIHAARHNGVVAMGALWGYGSRSELEDAGAHWLLAAPEEIPHTLQRI